MWNIFAVILLVVGMSSVGLPVLEIVASPERFPPRWYEHVEATLLPN